MSKITPIALRKSPRKSPVKGKGGLSVFPIKKATSMKQPRAKIWSKTTTESFIQSVEKHPVLYDVSLSEYKNNVAQATARAVIGREFSISPDDVKKKWKQLKDTYRNEKKRLSEEDPSGSGFEGSKRSKKQCVYFDQMGFLATVYDEAERTTNADDDFEDGNKDLSFSKKKITISLSVVGDDEESRQVDDIDDISASESVHRASPDNLENSYELSDAIDQSMEEKEQVAGSSSGSVAVVKKPGTAGFKTPISPSPSMPRKNKGKKKSPEAEAKKNIQDVLADGKPEPKTKPGHPERALNAVQEDWINYGKNLGLRVAAINDENARDIIRHDIEQAVYHTKLELKKKRTN